MKSNQILYGNNREINQIKYKNFYIDLYTRANSYDKIFQSQG